MDRRDRLNFDGERRTLPPTVRRLLLAALAVGGTALYVKSFRQTTSARELLPLSSAVAVAAGGAWIVFGAILLGVTRGRATVTACVDLCLEVMALGMIPLLTAALANDTAFARGRVGPVPIDAGVVLSAHAALLLIAAVLMGEAFVSAAPLRLRLSPRRALLVWIFGLNGAFAALLAVLVAGRAFR